MERRAEPSRDMVSYKWLALIAAGFDGMCAVARGSALWQRTEVDELTAHRSALEADIAAMQVNAAELAKKGGRIKITDCGGRIVASKNQTGSFSEWHGLWNDAKTGQTMV